MELADIHDAIQTSSTWTDLRERISDRAYTDLLAHLDDEQRPAEGDTFDSEEIVPYLEGDWPAWPAQRMLDWVPARIRREFGHAAASAISGDSLVLPADRQDEIVAAFAREGFRCRRDDELVRRATHGHG